MSGTSNPGAMVAGLVWGRLSPSTSAAGLLMDPTPTVMSPWL